MTIDDIKLHLPPYLSVSAKNALKTALQYFPVIASKRFYTNSLRDTQIIYQGDGIKDLIAIDLPATETKIRPGLILSNTCDISPDNKRPFQSRMDYVPIVSLATYEAILKESIDDVQKIDAHISSIRSQEITQIFYLPEFENTLPESIVFLDRIQNLPVGFVDRTKLTEQRLFTLSDAGHYLFLFKLSFHFTRMQDKVERGSTE